MGYDIVVYLGPLYSVYALINLLFLKISGFMVYFRIKRSEDNTPLNFSNNNHDMNRCILFILTRYKYYTYMGMIILLNN